MIYHGHLAHPDIWMLWYAVWFCAVLTLYHSINIIYWLKAHVFIRLAEGGRGGSSRLIVSSMNGWHHVAHIGPVQFELFTWRTIFINKKG